MTRQETDKEIFAAYAASAPRLDLDSYIDYAQRHRDEYTPEIRAIVSDMIAYADELFTAPKGSIAAQKRAAWSLISRFKASIGPGPHVDPHAHRAEMMQTQIALWVTRGAYSVLLDPKTPVIEAIPRQTVDAAPAKPQPVNWKARALELTAKFKTAWDDGYRAGLQDARNTSQPAAPKKRAMIRVRDPKPLPALDGEKTCKDCQRVQPLNQFNWAAHGQIRNTCRSCRKAQAAARVHRAA